MSSTTLSRRRFLGAAALGAAAVATAGATGAPASATDTIGRRLIPRGRVGIQMHSVRDKVPELGWRFTMFHPARGIVRGIKGPSTGATA